MAAPQRPLHAGHDGAVAERCVADLDTLMRSAMLVAEDHAALARDVNAIGAVHIQKLARPDWEQLESWQLLKAFERRRVLQHMPHECILWRFGISVWYCIGRDEFDLETKQVFILQQGSCQGYC